PPPLPTPETPSPSRATEWGAVVPGPECRTSFPGDLVGDSRFDRRNHHSGLGMASFVIALLVGGLDVILAVAIATGIARSQTRAGLQNEVLGGGMAMYCLNCMSVPLCLVGVGLAIVGLVAHRDRNHLFTWIGLLGNGVVILGVLGLFVLTV